MHVFFSVDCVLIDMVPGHSPEHEPLMLHHSDNSALAGSESYRLLLEKTLPLGQTLSAQPSLSGASGQALPASDLLLGMLCGDQSAFIRISGQDLCLHFIPREEHLHVLYFI